MNHDRSDCCGCPGVQVSPASASPPIANHPVAVAPTYFGSVAVQRHSLRTEEHRFLRNTQPLSHVPHRRLVLVGWGW